MNRKLEAGPALLLVGAVLLFISLFLDWYDDVLNAWEAFEFADLLLAALALAVATAAAGFFRRDIDVVDRRWVPALAVTALVVVVSQLLDAPPAVPGDTVEIGAWLAFAAVILIAVGALLTFGRVSFELRVDGRDDVAAPARAETAAPAGRRDHTEATRPIATPPAAGTRAGDTQVDVDPASRRAATEKPPV